MYPQINACALIFQTRHLQCSGTHLQHPGEGELGMHIGHHPEQQLQRQDIPLISVTQVDILHLLCVCVCACVCVCVWCVRACVREAKVTTRFYNNPCISLSPRRERRFPKSKEGINKSLRQPHLSHTFTATSCPWCVVALKTWARLAAATGS